MSAYATQFVLLSSALLSLGFAGCAQVPSNADLTALVNQQGVQPRAGKRSSSAAHLARKAQRTAQKPAPFKRLGQQLASVTKRSAARRSAKTSSQKVDRERLLAKAESLESHARIDEAIATYEQILSAFPNDAQALHRLAVCHDRGGDAAASSRLYLRAMHFNPSDPELLCDYGYSRYAHGDALQAESMLRRALQIDKGHARSHANLGLVLAKQGRRDEAIASFLNCGIPRADAEENVRNVMQQEKTGVQNVAVASKAVTPKATSQLPQQLVAKTPAVAKTRTLAKTPAVKATLVSTNATAAKRKVVTIPSSSAKKTESKRVVDNNDPFAKKINLAADESSKKGEIAKTLPTPVEAVATSDLLPPAPPGDASATSKTGASETIESQTINPVANSSEAETGTVELSTPDAGLLQSLVDNAVDESLQYINNSLRQTIRR